MLQLLVTGKEKTNYFHAQRKRVRKNLTRICLLTSEIKKLLFPTLLKSKRLNFFFKEIKIHYAWIRVLLLFFNVQNVFYFYLVSLKSKKIYHKFYKPTFAN